jgi:sulfur-carrier protein
VVAVSVFVPSALRQYAAGQRKVELDLHESGATLAGVFDQLRGRYPGVCERALDEQGNVRQHVNVFVDGEPVRGQGGLQTRVHAGAEVWILPAVSGG